MVLIKKLKSYTYFRSTNPREGLQIAWKTCGRLLSISGLKMDSERKGVSF